MYLVIISEGLKMVKRVLVIGAAGFIGSNLTKKLVKNDYEVVVLKRSTDNLDRLTEVKEKLRFYDSDKDQLDQAFTENKIDLVINLATNFGRSKDAKTSDLVSTNILFAIQVAEVAVRNKVEYLFNTDSSLDPAVNLYAYTKKVAKQLLKDYFANSIKIFNLRLEYVYGPHDDLNKMIPMAVDKLKNNLPLELTPAEQDLDFLNIEDCTDAFLYVISHQADFANDFIDLQIGSGQTTKIKDLILMIKAVAGSESKIQFGAVSYREHEQMYSKADLTTMKGWQPKVSVEQGIKDLIV
jgi:nucleoside-diphosphate-sugar epimerase